MNPGNNTTRITDAFRLAGFPLIKNRKSRAFSVDIGNGQKFINIYFDCDSWLRLEMLLTGEKDTDNACRAWDLLCRNSEINGPARFFRTDTNSFGIKADIHLSRDAGESTLISCIKNAVSSLTSACDLSRWANGNGIAHGARKPVFSDKIRTLCDDSGWHFVDYGSLSDIKLKVTEGIYHAHVEVCPEGGFLLVVTLEDVTDWKIASRDALAEMLLKFIKNIRLVRPSSLVNAKESQVVMCEVFLGEDFSTGDLNLGLSSLSIACQIIGREVSVLRSERIAGKYLVINSWPCANGRHHQKKE